MAKVPIGIVVFVTLANGDRYCVSEADAKKLKKGGFVDVTLLPSGSTRTINTAQITDMSAPT